MICVVVGNRLVTGLSEGTRKQHLSLIQNASTQRTQAILADLVAERDSIRSELAASKALYDAICALLGKGTSAHVLVVSPLVLGCDVSRG